MIKVIASGFIFGPNTYLHTGWNVMDGFLVIISVVDLGTMNRGIIMSPTESDTTSHILVINRTSGLKLVVQALLSSLRPIDHIVINCCIFFIIFGNVGVQALLTLFVLSSKDGWVQIMYNTIDAVDVEMQPIRNYSEAKSIYFISFISIVSFFVLNMF
ncbi:unnamed protein product, partial [Rotaria sp. Silwood2]